MEENIITLEFDDGKSEECEIIGIFDYEGNDYIALAPVEGEDVYIYGYRDIDENEFDITDIEDEELFEKVVEEFDSLMAD